MTTRQTPDAVREAYRQGQADMRERAAQVCDQRGAEEQEGFGLVRGTQNYFRARNAIRELEVAALDSRAGDAGEVETDDKGEAMVCTGCGTTRTVAAIVARSAAAFTCCPERKMVPVRSLWSAGAPCKDTITFVQEWMMSSDHEPDQWHRDFAAAIDARVSLPDPAKLAERFCATPLPESVAADLCATQPGTGRYGTNLLTVAEAAVVLRQALSATPAPPVNAPSECPECGDTSPLEECATCGAYPTRKDATPAPAVDAQEALRMWQVKGPCNTIMWETNRTSGQFADPVAAVSCALSLPLPVPAVDAVPAGEVGRLNRIRTSMVLLQQNSEMCARNHYDNDDERFGMPGWLFDTKADLDAFTDILSALSHGEGRK